MYFKLGEGDRNGSDISIGDSLNFRLGTKGLSITELSAEASKRNMSLTEVVAMPELNSYEYSSYYHDGRALVCSSFVTEMWRAGGLFGNLTINSAEWGPRDVYQVKFFNEQPDYYPEKCN